MSTTLGSAIAAAVVAGSADGGYDDFAEAQEAMTGVKDVTYKPNPENHKIYQQLYELYRQIHDAFGLSGTSATLANVMKDLLELKETVSS